MKLRWRLLLCLSGLSTNFLVRTGVRKYHQPFQVKGKNAPLPSVISGLIEPPEQRISGMILKLLFSARATSNLGDPSSIGEYHSTNKVTQAFNKSEGSILSWI
ncbi:hypothetical protein ASPVEDRAFT_420431 [Aspergillus versicolor CBS 583.65]|uniref:Uncharacterized protein n=1 Tax=Aspergillus versicolor CBS 583.65 TaxID=1036611 RepID=A0A1L9Q5I3_ASPVE|nr:uncharacterized protein ASPVEDRAFT_420431 [Aspergillus versicolor CBS 583.65]OJJ08948.1 hypothetical protein ASPVEDRAFT_420431 [Aspergillus versicolor CBS 583.65]